MLSELKRIQSRGSFRKTLNIIAYAGLVQIRDFFFGVKQRLEASVQLVPEAVNVSLPHLRSV